MPAHDDTPPSRPTHTLAHGISLTGRLFDEGTILNIGHASEQRLAAWDRRPPLPTVC